MANKYLNSKNLIYNESTTRNVLYKITNGKIIFKLGDFGSISNIKTEYYFENFDYYIGILACSYISPEFKNTFDVQFNIFQQKFIKENINVTEEIKNMTLNLVKTVYLNISNICVNNSIKILLEIIFISPPKKLLLNHSLLYDYIISSMYYYIETPYLYNYIGSTNTYDTSSIFKILENIEDIKDKNVTEFLSKNNNVVAIMHLKSSKKVYFLNKNCIPLMKLHFNPLIECYVHNFFINECFFPIVKKSEINEKDISIRNFPYAEITIKPYHKIKISSSETYSSIWVPLIYCALDDIEVVFPHKFIIIFNNLCNKYKKTPEPESWRAALPFENFDGYKIYMKKILLEYNITTRKDICKLWDKGHNGCKSDPCLLYEDKENHLSAKSQNLIFNVLDDIPKKTVANLVSEISVQSYKECSGEEIKYYDKIIITHIATLSWCFLQQYFFTLCSHSFNRLSINSL
jgi:hypothetical protein